MMYRSGWGEKDKNQVVTLGIYLKRKSFERILSHVIHSGYNPAVYSSQEEYNKQVSKAKQDNFGFVRLQWDPDHSPGGAPHPHRRAIQLGLKGVKSFISGEDIVKIVDMSDFVAEQRVKKSNPDELDTPAEKVYVLEDKALEKMLRITPWGDTSAKDDGNYKNSPANDDDDNGGNGDEN